VRVQKFTDRLRPKARAARLAKPDLIGIKHLGLCGAFRKTCDDLDAYNAGTGASTLQDFAAIHSADAAGFSKGDFLLPIAFGGGSSMRLTYGAAQATVAGACTTILKAFFDTCTVLGLNADSGCNEGHDGFHRNTMETPYSTTALGVLQARSPRHRVPAQDPG
jgi:hypothetical protein